LHVYEDQGESLVQVGVLDGRLSSGVFTSQRALKRAKSDAMYVRSPEYEHEDERESAKKEQAPKSQFVAPAVVPTRKPVVHRSSERDTALARYNEIRKELIQARAPVGKVYSILKTSPTQEAVEEALQLYAQLRSRFHTLVEESNVLKAKLQQMNKNEK
jgi:hypothetical protein